MDEKEERKELISLQNQFYKKMVSERTPVIVFFVNGFQMRGIITKYDSYTIEFYSDGAENLIYKHAISTIKVAGTRNFSPPNGCVKGQIV